MSKDALEALIRRSENRGRPGLSPVLWDTDPNQIDEERDATFLIVRILTAGRPEHVSWMFRRYPAHQIEGAILRDKRLTARVRGAWANLLGLAGTQIASVEPSP